MISIVGFINSWFMSNVYVNLKEVRRDVTLKNHITVPVKYITCASKICVAQPAFYDI